MNSDDARAIQRALEILQKASTSAEPSITVAELHAQYEPWYRATHPKSYKSAFVPRWRNLNKFFGKLPAASLTLVHADAYRKERAKAAPETRNCELSGIRALCAWAVKRRLLRFNPFTGLELEPARNQRTAFLDEDGFSRLAAAAPNPMSRVLFTVAFDSGMRRGELMNLRRVDVDLEARLVRLGDADCKNGTGRVVPLTKRAVAALSELPTWSPYVFSITGGPLKKTTLHKWFAVAREKSQTPANVCFHSLRHSAATLMRRRGVPWPLIKVALGWKSEVAARRYQNFNEDDWASLRERMDSGIETERRKPALRAVPAKTEAPNALTPRGQGQTEK